MTESDMNKITEDIQADAQKLKDTFGESLRLSREQWVEWYTKIIQEMNEEN